ncbi:protein 175-like [Vespula squamosa]|uniref:Protein 175-like n=1 Tax=Vespula squamosa TaxID=30214 RepID=A0ABD2B3I1_VESSQ
MMNQDTIVKLMTPLANNNGDGLYTQALLPGLFRAIIVKLNNKNNKYDDNNNNPCQKRKDGITSKYGTSPSARPDCDRRKIHLQSSNLSIGDILLIANDSHETVSTNPGRPNVCPAYRFCVERNTADNMVTTDQDSIVNSELPTLRELLEPIKQTALKMKQLSQLKDEVPQTEIVCHQLRQTKDQFREPEDVSSTCQTCGMKFGELRLNPSDCESRQKGNIFGERDKVDGNISVQIISRPETEAQYVLDDPLLNLIRQIVTCVLNISKKHQEQLECQKKEAPLCKSTEKECLLCPGCLKPRSITATDDEYSEMKDRSVQFQDCLKQEPSIVDDDSVSIQSYEFIKTMDVGCECEVEKKIHERDATGNCCEECEVKQNSSLNTFLSNILTMLITGEIDYLKNVNVIDSIYSTKSKCELCDHTSSISSKKDKCTDCTCDFDSGVISSNEIEVTNELSYLLENVEAMSMEINSKKDVATSTYSISVFSQVTSMLQMKSSKSQKLSSSAQCDIGPESMCKLSLNIASQVTSDIQTRIITKEQDYSNLEELCPCGCGYFLESESTCSCECLQYSNSPCVPLNDVKEVKKKMEYTSSSIMYVLYQKKSRSNQTIKFRKNNHKNNCQLCTCSEISNLSVPLDPIVKRMNNIIENHNTIPSSQTECDKNCKYSDDEKQLNLEEEARKLQQKIESYKKENEYFRELIQSCSGCRKNAEILSCPPPIRATYSGLATAIDILQTKCKSKDSMIAILAEGLRGVVNYAQIAKNLAAPCLEYTYWDFDRFALYTYLRKTMSKVSVEKKPSSSNEIKKENGDTLPDPSCDDTVPPSPTDFKVVQSLCKCLLLSWKIPEDIKNVAGYRIYVNGNSVTNVNSPTRTETILGFMDFSEPTELKLHSFNKKGILSEPVTITYSPNNPNNDSDR